MIEIISKKGIAVDQRNMRQVILDMPKYINQGWNLAGSFSVNDAVNKIFFVGMGGSAIAGEILKMYLTNDCEEFQKQQIPIEIVRDYSLPATVDEHSLVFIVSYSGNTEETIAAFREALKKKAVCICLATGGKIQEIAKTVNTPCILLPKGMQPRASLALQFFVLLRIMQNSNYIKNQKENLEESVRVVSNPEKIEQAAQQLVQSAKGKIILLYSSSRLFGLAYRWKCQINENAKQHSFVGVLSELNHNELVAFMTKMSPIHVIFLKDENDHPQIKKRVAICKELIIKRGYSTTEIAVGGKTELSKIFSGILLGDLFSYYLAIENNVDPTPIEIIDELKKRLVN